MGKEARNGERLYSGKALETHEQEGGEENGHALQQEGSMAMNRDNSAAWVT